LILDHFEKANAFSNMSRRVCEKVQFGDSEAALELLQTFEKDEVTIREDVRVQFDRALSTLKLAGTNKKAKRLKQLKEK
jgi:hypothetical protein